MADALVKTSELKEGDIIRYYGHEIQIGTINHRVEDAEDPFGTVYWSRSVILNPDAGGIPKSWMDRDDESRPTWSVQGNDRAQWCRISTALERAMTDPPQADAAPINPNQYRKD